MKNKESTSADAEVKGKVKLHTKKTKITLFTLLIALDCTTKANVTAQQNKILHVAMDAPDDGFDMVKTSNIYSGKITGVIFEPLLKYDYLARPVQLVPNTAMALPRIIRNWLLHPQVLDFKAHPMMNSNWQYLDNQPLKQ